MVKKKICLLGAAGVGKSSLAERFMKGTHTSYYRATVGAKVHRKTIGIGSLLVDLMIWDMAGESAERLAHSPYIRRAAGHLVVSDGTRPDTVLEALSVAREVAAIQGGLPMVFAVNKSDLVTEWAVTEANLSPLTAFRGKPLRTSAKTGAGVESAFLQLVGMILAPATA